MRIERLEAAAALVAREVLAEALDLPLRLLARLIDVGDVHHPFAKFQGGLDGVGQPAPLGLADDHSVNDHFHRVLAAMVDLRRVVHGVRLAVDAHPHETRAANLVEQRFVLFLPAPLDGRHQV
jgi:hypothetical protein